MSPAERIPAVAHTFRRWSRNGGPPLDRLAEGTADFVTRRVLLRVLQLHDPHDPTPETTLRQALKRVGPDDRRRLCSLLAGWCECTGLGEPLVDRRRLNRLPPSIRTLIP